MLSADLKIFLEFLQQKMSLSVVERQLQRLEAYVNRKPIAQPLKSKKNKTTTQSNTPQNIQSNNQGKKRKRSKSKQKSKKRSKYAHEIDQLKKEIEENETDNTQENLQLMAKVASQNENAEELQAIINFTSEKQNKDRKKKKKPPKDEEDFLAPVLFSKTLFIQKN
eukprot:TRINITY_DN1878_c0_g1_i2.p1 TRINITY_DN1878_c0_g1~~TRINITY_DN1878_c0_g1_i2.p1  ORF type:complete len:166 (+),score=49.72 TRINITY_DN1878_c0_g1_i2:120-617(+)